MEWTAEGTGIEDAVVRNFIRDTEQMAKKFLELRAQLEALQQEALDKLGAKAGATALIGASVLDMARLAMNGLPKDQASAVASDAGRIMALICGELLDMEEGKDSEAIREYSAKLYRTGQEIENLCALAAKLATK